MKQLNFTSGLKQVRAILVCSVFCLLLQPSQSQAQDGSSMYDAIHAGYFSSTGGGPYYDSRNTYYYNGISYYDNYYSNNGQPSPDVWYYIQIDDYANLQFSLCGSNFNTYLHLLDEYGNEVASNDDSYECGSQSFIEYNSLPSGNYYIVIEGSGYDSGDFYFEIQSTGGGCNSSPSAGANMSNAITAGTFSASGSYTDTRSNVDACLGNDIGQTSNDIYYQFTLNGTATVSLSHCGSGFDTYMWLLDAWGNTITYNDDNSSSPCPGTQSYIQTTLSAGTYYVVSEGYSSNIGNIATSIDVNMSSPMTITYAGSSQTYVQGTPITPLSPTVTGGTPSSGGQTTISLAGNGIAGSQNGTGAGARFDWPLGTAVDASGNVYVADSENEMVRKITPEGVVTTFAGNGNRGATNGTGTGATFKHPAALAIDASGNIYVGDQQNHMIRKITPAGVVTTFAGSGAAGSANGTGSSATFNNPIGLAFDQSGNLYVADYANHKIRKITPAGVVSTYAGTGSIGATNGAAASATFKNPMSVAVDASGNVYVGDRMNYMVRKITPGGVVSTLAGSGSAGSADGTGTSASFNVPNSVAVDGSGNVYVADQLNNKIRKISPSGVVSTFAGAVTAGNTDGTGSAVRFNNPYGLCIDSQDNLYIADYHNHKIRKMMTRAFVISPDLPAGLVFNSSNGTISGTPAVASAATNYTIYAQSASSSTSPPFTMNITVQGSSSCPSLAPVLSQDQNYIVTYSPRAPITSTSQLASAGVCTVQQTVQYFDGLGRPLQTVQTKASPNADKDIVIPVEYDAYGREAKKYLPYAAPGTANGSYKADALTTGAGAFIFYNPAGSTDPQLPGGIPRIPTPFAETEFEASPLNRVKQQGAPGDAWQLASGHTVRQFYETNVANEVSRWDVSGTGAYVNGSYAAGTLYKTRSQDENGHEAIEYKDLEGRVVLKKVQDSPSSYASTYYIYDDFGNLSFVVPPKVTVTTFDENTTEFITLMYGFRYDERNRLVKKKIPGKGWESMVYNKLDQVVATQDALQAATNLYTFTKYDGLGRVIMTGEVSDSRSSETLQTDLKSQTINWETPNSSYAEGYTQSSFPASWNKLFTVSYYDNYTYLYPGNPYPATPTGITTRTTGLLTANKVRNLETGTMLWTVNYYNEEGRLRESIVQNHIGGADRIVNDYNNITGELTQSTRTHSSTAVSSLVIINQYTYDHMGRKKQSWQKTGASGTNVMLSQLEYNEVGQLHQKKLHSEDGTSFIEPITYTYNPRGWLAGISSSKLTEQLYYDTAPFSGITPNYNGNITEAWYTTPNRGDRRFYYKYDEANRLEESRYHTGITHTGELDEVMSYDKMGNIENLTRGNSGLSFTHSGTFAYTNAGNRLATVTNNGNAYRSYSYDNNGNVTADGALGFEYNELNLPRYVKQNNAPVITYTYTATGQKLKKSSGQSGVTDYVSGIQYINNGATIDFIQTEEGRYEYSSGKYQYNLKDHLGNVRVMIDKNTATSSTAVQENEYYAFGLNVNRTTISPDNKYLYNGKELQDDYGLNQLDYGARFYDPVIGRWNVVDALADEPGQIDASPYAYTGNNPISRIDPDGNCWTCLPLNPIQTVESMKTVVKFVGNTTVAIINTVLDPISNANYAGNTTGEKHVAYTKAADEGVKTLAADGLMAGAVGKVVGKVVGAVAKTEVEAASSVAKKSDVFQVTKEGVVLPKGKSIPANLTENPFNPPGTSSFGKMENGKFVEGLRIDPATAAGTKGPNYSHYHKDGKKPHYSPNGKDKDPGF